MTELIELQTCEIDYETLCQKLFNEWHFVPFQQFEPYQRYPNTELSGNKIIDLEHFGGEDCVPNFEEHSSHHFMIRVKDLLDIFCAIQR